MAKKRIKMVSWNVNGLFSCLSKALIDFIKKENADFYFFQEIKTSEKALKLKFEGYDTYWSFAEKKGYSGVGVLTRSKPISVVEGIGDKDFDREGRVLTLEYEKYFLINAYFPHSQRELKRLEYKLRFNRRFHS